MGFVKTKLKKTLTFFNSLNQKKIKNSNSHSNLNYLYSIVNLEYIASYL